MRNNLDLLRMIFAGTVLLVHARELSGFQELNVLTKFLSSAVAVKSFFVVSGFLIFMSFERSMSLASYAEKRIRRIYPAYFSTILVCAFSLLAVSSKPTGEYFSGAWLRYVFSNLAFLNFLQPSLPGVFEENKLDAVNGALWSLKIEVAFYITVPIFAYLFRRFSRLAIIATVYCLSVAYPSWVKSEELARQLPGQLCYFMAGAFFYYYWPFFERNFRKFLMLTLLCLFEIEFFALPLLEPFALATVVIFLGTSVYLGNFGKFGDFSYGVYILHFPIIQTLVWTGRFENEPWHFLISAIFFTAIGAAAMWHFVEKRFLFRSSHYVGASGSSCFGMAITTTEQPR